MIQKYLNNKNNINTSNINKCCVTGIFNLNKMKNLILFLIGKYRKSIIVENRKRVWRIYQETGFTSTGYKVYKSLK